MTNYSIYTRRTMGLDGRVWLTMIVIIILATGLLGYRLSDHTECIAIDDFTIKDPLDSDAIYKTGKTLFFKSFSRSTAITWDFGDKTPKTYGRETMHSYQNAGDYTIIASTATGCEKVKRIHVEKSAPVQNPEPVPTGNEITSPTDTFIALKEVSFICMVSAGSYEWTIENYPKLTRSGQAVKFIFPRPGNYRIQVILDNNRSNRITKDIQVLEELVVPDSVIFKPTPNPGPATGTVNPPPPLPGPPDTSHAPPPLSVPATDPTKGKRKIPESAFAASLREIMKNENADINGLFYPYLVSEGNTKVQLKGGGDFKTFSWLVNELKGKDRKYKLKSVNLERDAANDINVMIIKVDYEKWSLKDRVLGRNKN